MNKPILFLLALALFAGSCNKDDNNGGSKTDNLTSGKWKLSTAKATFNVGGVNQTIDIITLLQPCELDNFFTFQSGGVITNDEGATKCNSGDPQTQTGTWSLTQNETHLVVATPDLTFDAEITDLSSSNLRIKYILDFNGLPATYDVLYINF